MESRVGQYLSSHPVLALTVMLFGAMATLPVGLFLVFALVTIVMSAVGFVFFEGKCAQVKIGLLLQCVVLWQATHLKSFSLCPSVFLLFVGGLTLLCVLSGLAFFSVIVSFIFSVFYSTIFNILNYYDPRLTKVTYCRSFFFLLYTIYNAWI